jgi:hypothetical protein
MAEKGRSLEDIKNESVDLVRDRDFENFFFRFSSIIIV